MRDARGRAIESETRLARSEELRRQIATCSRRLTCLTCLNWSMSMLMPQEVVGVVVMVNSGLYLCAIRLESTTVFVYLQPIAKQAYEITRKRLVSRARRLTETSIMQKADYRNEPSAHTLCVNSYHQTVRVYENMQSVCKTYATCVRKMRNMRRNILNVCCTCRRFLVF